MKHKITILLVLVIVMCSCSRTLLKIYGINSHYTSVNDDNLVQLSQKYNIPLDDFYELDITFYDFLLSFDKNIYSGEINNHLQPLQVLYFNHDGQLISYHVNCDMGGFPNLKWNKNNTFNSFIPNTQTQIDSLVSLNTFSQYLIPTNFWKSFLLMNYDYVVVIVWADYMGRQSEKLCNLVRQNTNLASENQKVKIIYVNVDNFDQKVALKNIK